MISIVEGFGVGSGKSYFVVTELLRHWLRGGTAYIADTMAIKWSEVVAYGKKVHGVQFEDSQFHEFPEEALIELHKHTPPGTDGCPVLIVADECQGALNSRDWNDKSKRGLFDWATQSRHDDNDLLFISQSAQNIDKQVRRLATYVWRIRNSDSMGENNAFRFILSVWRVISFGLHGGPMFIISQLDQDGRKPLGKKVFVRHDSMIFGLYDSKAMRGKHKRRGEAVGKVTLAKVNRRTGELVAPKVKKEKKPMSFIFKASIGAGVLLLAVLGWKLAHTDWDFGKSRREAALHSQAGVPVASASAVAPAVVVPPAGPAYQVRQEEFRGSSQGVLRTSGGEYVKGRMSPSGMVQAISPDSVVKIQTPDSSTLYVVVDGILGSPPGLAPSLAMAGNKLPPPSK